MSCDDSDKSFYCRRLLWGTHKGERKCKVWNGFPVWFCWAWICNMISFNKVGKCLSILSSAHMYVYRFDVPQLAKALSIFKSLSLFLRWDIWCWSIFEFALRHFHFDWHPANELTYILIVFSLLEFPFFLVPISLLKFVTFLIHFQHVFIYYS